MEEKQIHVQTGVASPAPPRPHYTGLCRLNRSSMANTDDKSVDQPGTSMGHSGDEQE